VNANVLAVARALTFVFIALVVCGLIFAAAGYPSITLFASIAAGALFSNHAILHTLRWAMPLFITALGVIVTFRCGYFNIGAQGQFYLGAIGASFVADRLIGGPPLLVIPLSMLAGAIGGALWALWPGLLR
jgi:simple sugar transport system permease protein